MKNNFGAKVGKKAVNSKFFPNYLMAINVLLLFHRHPRLLSAAAQEVAYSMFIA